MILELSALTDHGVAEDRRSTASDESGRLELHVPEKTRSSGNSVKVDAPTLEPRAAPAVTFRVDDTGDTFVQVIDRDSGKVIREIPPEELRKIAAELKELTGTVLNTVA
jgi:flagellar protein FlaG